MRFLTGEKFLCRHYTAIVKSVNVTTLKSSGNNIRRAKSPEGISVVSLTYQGTVSRADKESLALVPASLLSGHFQLGTTVGDPFLGETVRLFFALTTSNLNLHRNRMLGTYAHMTKSEETR